MYNLRVDQSILERPFQLERQLNVASERTALDTQ